MAMLWLFVGAILGFNVCFNHLLACIVKANGPAEIKIIERLRLQYKQRQSRKEVDAESDRFVGLSADIKSALKYRTRTLDQLRSVWNRQCNKCMEIKPGRTHHCAVCNRCVFMMDHHCPWVNNCLGMENYRYFLLFIFYLMIGSAWYLMTIISIWDHHIYVSSKSKCAEIAVAAACFLVSPRHGADWGFSVIQRLALVPSLLWHDFNRVFEKVPTDARQPL